MIFTLLIYCPKVCIENPIGIMSTYYKKPTQIIQPYQFGHTERKATCLWLKGLPPLKPTNIVEPDIIKHPSGKTDSRLHYIDYIFGLIVGAILGWMWHGIIFRR